VDGERIKSDEDLLKAGVNVYKDWEIKGHANSFWSRPIKKGEIGCSVSHWRVWKETHQRMKNDKNLQYVVVLEDDATFTAEAVSTTKKAISSLPSVGLKAWDLLYLGRVLQRGQKDEPINGLVVKPGFSYCTYGYCLSRSGVEKFIQSHFERNLIPVDELLPALYTQHPREDVRKIYSPSINAYSVNPYCVFQRSKSEAGSNTEDSEVVSFWTKD
jgi:collagen beta-1,O-galactosyltransferase